MEELWLFCEYCESENAHDVLKSRTSSNKGFTFQGVVKCTECSSTSNKEIKEEPPLILNLKVSDVLNESGSVKKEVRVKMKKTKKTTLNLPLSKNSIAVIKKYLLERKREDFIFRSTHYHYTRKPLSIYQYSRIVKNLLRDLGVEDVSEYSTHSIRKTKSSVIYD